MSLTTRFAGYIRRRRLAAANERVLIAVSGGIDSVVLLHLFRTVAPKLGIEICAAHFDHAMRADSATDAEWLAALCETWQVPLVNARSTRELTSELAARQERYRFLTRALRLTDSQKAATAHHADDQVETVLLRMLRGAGIRGLSGIPVRRGPFIRPMLRFTKAEIIEYAEANGIRHREDATNAEDRYLRNRVRHTVVPALEQVTPHARASVLALARHAARTEAAWHSILTQIETDVAQTTGETAPIQLARDVLLKYHPALRARVIRYFLRRFGVVPGRASTHHILNFCAHAESGSVLEVAGRARIERSFDRLLIARSPRAAAGIGSITIEGDAGQQELQLGADIFRIAWRRGATVLDDAESFDAATLHEPLTMRGWRPGDRIQLPYGTKKLKKLFSERRIAVSGRAQIPILVDDHGQVLWVAGVARSVHALPAQSGSVLNIMVANAELG